MVPESWRLQPHCGLCGYPFDLVRLPATMDHIIPVSWGAPGYEWNSRATHEECNRRRGNIVLHARESASLVSNFRRIAAAHYEEADLRKMARQLIEAYAGHHRRRIKMGHKPPPARNAYVPHPLVTITNNRQFPWDLAPEWETPGGYLKG